MDICILPFDAGVSMHRSTYGVAVVHDLPIITTRGESMESPFVDGQNLLLCPPRDSRAMAEAIIRLASSPELQKQLREGAGRMAGEYFSWDTCLKKTVQVFQGNDSN